MHCVYDVEMQHGQALRSQLERTAIRDRELDRDVASDCFAVDNEAWRKLDIEEPEREPAVRGAAKSTWGRSTPR